ncbi:MAG: hypothetical protein IPH21_09245 [Flavobacteriales bacterium]|nr:hypothetical protein [Flavobacteriales bacterium]
MPLLYDLGTRCYHLGIRLAAPFVPKAKQWVNGRKGTWERLASVSKKVTGCLWMHAASVGEFEQGLPVLEAIKKFIPTFQLWSPSSVQVDTKPERTTRSLIMWNTSLPMDAPMQNGCMR